MAQPYKKRKYGDSKPSSRIMQIDRPIKKVYRRTEESKWFESTAGPTALDSAGTLLSSSINLVDEGNGVDQMAGRKIVITRIQIRMTVIAPSSSNATLGNVVTSPEYRIMLVQDRQCNGASLSIASVLQTTNTKGYNNLSNARRFKILKDCYESTSTSLTFNSNTLVYACGEVRKVYDYYIKCFIPVMFSEQAGGSRVIGEVLSNNLAVIGFSSSSGVTLAYRTRIRFNDN